MKTEIFFYKLKKLKKKAKEKIIFVKFAPERSAPKCISNKMSNAEKGPQQNGRDKKDVLPAKIHQRYNQF